LEHEKNNKEGKEPYPNYYIGICVAFGLIIGTVLGILIPAIGIAMGSGIGLLIGVVIGTYLQKKHGIKPK